MTYFFEFGTPPISVTGKADTSNLACKWIAAPEKQRKIIAP